MTRFVQIAWLKSSAQLFGDLKEILVQRDVDVDYRGGPIIFFSAQIPQFAYARNRICPTSRGDPTPHTILSLSIYCNVKSEFANAALARNFVSIRHRYHPDIDLGVRHGCSSMCAFYVYKLPVPWKRGLVGISSLTIYGLK